MSGISSSMVSDADFIRWGLRATRNGEIKPESLLAEWLGAFDTLRAALDKAPPGELSQFLEILAVTGRFRRTTFAETDPSVQERLAWADRVIEQLHQEDCEKAIRFLSHKNFLEDAKRLRKSESDNLVDHPEAVRKAIAILSDWDDSGIILALLGECFEIPNTDIGKARSEFLTWLCTEGDSILLLVANWGQTMAAAFDPELAERHLELDVSTQGYVLLLDALEEIEKAMDCHPDWIAAKIEGLARLERAIPASEVCSFGKTEIGSKRRLFFVGMALSLFVTAVALFLTVFHGDKRSPGAVAQTAWLARDFESLPTAARTAGSATGIMTPDEVEQRQKDFDMKIVKSPENVDLLLEYGRFLLKRNRLDEAVVVFERVRHTASNSPYAELGIGIAEVLRQKYEKALVHFEEAIGKSETEPWARLSAHVNAAECCKQLGNRDNEASEHRKAAIELINAPTISGDPAVQGLVEKLQEDILYELHLE